MNRREQAKKLGEMLRKLISDRGWSVNELARQADLAPSTTINYVNGMVFPNKESREKLCGLFNLTVREFDALFGITTLTEPKVDEVCRDIRSMNPEDFAIVVSVVFDRIQAELQARSTLPPS